mmetsp:Transcript_13615/g.39006  ORF Transcript_13615/g.39006 Transcript_13615/m.39006 type:complete len:220 (+) Transcript_13615:305-964(+)
MSLTVSRTAKNKDRPNRKTNINATIVEVLKSKVKGSSNALDTNSIGLESFQKTDTNKTAMAVKSFLSSRIARRSSRSILPTILPPPLPPCVISCSLSSPSPNPFKPILGGLALPPNGAPFRQLYARQLVRSLMQAQQKFAPQFPQRMWLQPEALLIGTLQLGHCRVFVPIHSADALSPSTEFRSGLNSDSALRMKLPSQHGHSTSIGLYNSRLATTAMK